MFQTPPFCLPFWPFFAIQLQGTLYNYYYVILRIKSVGGVILQVKYLNTKDLEPYRVKVKS